LNLATPKAAAWHELLLYKYASELGLLNTCMVHDGKFYYVLRDLCRSIDIYVVAH